MRKLREWLTVATIALVSLGYVGSQLSYPDRAADWSERIDRQPVVLLSLVLFLAAVVLAFIPPPNDEAHK